MIPFPYVNSENFFKQNLPFHDYCFPPRNCSCGVCTLIAHKLVCSQRFKKTLFQICGALSLIVSFAVFSYICQSELWARSSVQQCCEALLEFPFPELEVCKLLPGRMPVKWEDSPYFSSLLPPQRWQSCAANCLTSEDSCFIILFSFWLFVAVR